MNFVEAGALVGAVQVLAGTLFGLAYKTLSNGINTMSHKLDRVSDDVIRLGHTNEELLALRCEVREQKQACTAHQLEWVKYRTRMNGDDK